MGRVMELLLLVAGTVLGGVVSLATAVYWQDPLKDAILRRKRRRFASAIARDLLSSDGAVTIAGRSTQVHLIEGDGQSLLRPSDIRIRLSSSRTPLPEPVVILRDRRLVQIEASTADSEARQTWNSDTLVALQSYRIGRSGTRESGSIDAIVSPTDYATFMATVLSLDEPVMQEGTAAEGPTLRSLYLNDSSSIDAAIRRPLPALANGLGVSVVVFTDDDRVILTRRRAETQSRPNQHDVSVTEGFHAELDAGPNHSLSVVNCIARGCEEELGLKVGARDIGIIGLAVDLRYYQWNFISFVEAPYSAAEIEELYSLHAKDRWEGKLQIVDADPEIIFRLLRGGDMWDLGLTALYLALSYRTSPEKTRAAARKAYSGPG